MKGRHSPHKLVPSIRAEKSNNKIERLHGSEKSRTKVMRAFDQETGAAALMDGWRVHYDMVRTHQTLGKTPAEAADAGFYTSKELGNPKYPRMQLLTIEELLEGKGVQCPHIVGRDTGPTFKKAPKAKKVPKTPREKQSRLSEHS